MEKYHPIYLTTNEEEKIELEQKLEVLFDYLPTDEESTIYVQRIGSVIEIRPVEGSLESMTILSRGMSGAQPNRFSLRYRKSSV